MIAALLAGVLLASSSAPADSMPRLAPGDTGVDSAQARLVPPVTDTVPVRRRPRAVEVSDAYALRLRIHKYASYTMIPLFAVQTIAGNQLISSNPPGWAKPVHSAGAAGLGTLFTVNTVTGVWNLWEGRDVEEGRTRRWLHSALMIASDAGFTYAGVKLSQDAKRSPEGRNRHRNMAYISIGTALLGYGVMLFGNH